jgi:hypothetical protein
VVVRFQDLDRKDGVNYILHVDKHEEIGKDMAFLVHWKSRNNNFKHTLIRPLPLLPPIAQSLVKYRVSLYYYPVRSKASQN